MASQPYNQLNDTQKRLRKCIDLATDSVINYAAKEVPDLGNLTAEGMVEELGRLNEARKAVEKTEKIVKERLKSQLAGRTEISSDNYRMTLENRPRTALNQEKAKAYLEEQGILADFMETTAVPTTIIKPLGA
jgi:hypothetical protein